MSARLLVSGGRVVDPAAETVAVDDLLLEDGRIAARGPAGTIVAEAETLDARGSLVLPGLIDMHVHLREPGYEYKETVETGVAAALAGGFTSVACMANTNPVNDSGAVTRYILERAALARWRASTRSARSRSASKASAWRRSARCTAPASSRSPTTAGRSCAPVSCAAPSSTPRCSACR